ncbi:MAG TPA: (2Fe-2S)-binding protein [Usitatibacter sp.]|nr:(2Fe-2S)-binding protein [Usitatibacter sp.]
MYIWICNAVTEREIRGAAELGCATLEDLRRDLGVASCCGKCAPDTREILRQCAGGCSRRLDAETACGGSAD